VLLFLAVIVVALAGSMQDRSPTGQEALEATAVDEATLPETLPLHLVAGHLVVEATFDDDALARRMLLDSGAPSVVSDGLAERAGGVASGSLSTVTLGGEEATSSVVSLPEVRLGEAVFSDVGAIRGFVGPDNPIRCVAEDGIIGASLMKEAVWQIDYPAGEVTIAPGIEGLDHVDGAIHLDFSLGSSASPSPLVELPVGEGVLTFLLDTGSDGWLAVNPADLQGTGTALAPDAPASLVSAIDLAGPIATRIDWTAADIDLGGQAMWLPIATSELLPEGVGNMGNEFLSHFVVTIDWPGQTLYLDPAGPGPWPRVPLSVNVGWDGDGFVVGSLVEGLPETDAIELGAPVATIEGVEVSDATLDDYCRRLIGDAPETFEMTLAGEAPTTVDVAPVEDFFEPLGRPAALVSFPGFVEHRSRGVSGMAGCIREPA
jgi:hypothetical protein